VRGELFRHVGAPFTRWQRDNVLLPVVECRIRYKSAARYDDLLSTEVWLTDLGRVRLSFAYRMVNQSNAVILEASTLHACTSPDDKPQRLPDELITRLAPFLDKE
jgi:acyl-CoA thioester hydrolase